VNNPRLLEGKVVIVAGSGPGIGRDIALVLAGHGASIGLLARRRELLASLTAEIRDTGGSAHGVTCDITEPPECEAAVADVEARLGPVDALVCNASKLNDRTTILGASPRFENWLPYFGVILFGSLTIARAVVPGMRKRGSGSIVMINSMVADTHPSGYGAYPAAKSALESATRQLARELGPDRIRVNGVYPGVTAGATVDNELVPRLAAATGQSVEQVRSELEQRNALGFLASGSDIGHAVAFLLSDLARSITGQALHVNAGGHFH
jgi:NAD(P)-dependent dehydrogenase (short-subunit alcohol dehydrogenase family)